MAREKKAVSEGARERIGGGRGEVKVEGEKKKKVKGKMKGTRDKGNGRARVRDERKRKFEVPAGGVVPRNLLFNHTVICFGPARGIRGVLMQSRGQGLRAGRGKGKGT